MCDKNFDPFFTANNNTANGTSDTSGSSGGESSMPGVDPSLSKDFETLLKTDILNDMWNK